MVKGFIYFFLAILWIFFCDKFKIIGGIISCSINILLLMYITTDGRTKLPLFIKDFFQKLFQHKLKYALTFMLFFVSCVASFPEPQPEATEQIVKRNIPKRVNKKNIEVKKVQSKPLEKNTTLIEKGAGEWYVGGNLHEANKKDWLRGTYENRLATSGDFVANGINKKVLNLKPNGIEDLKLYAVEMENCITNAMKKDNNNVLKNVNEVGVFCIIALGWKD